MADEMTARSSRTVAGADTRRPVSASAHARAYKRLLSAGDVGDSELEAKFAFVWRALDGPDLELQHKFHPVRKWHFDFAHPATKTAVEIQGGIYRKGRHVRGNGYEGDREKVNTATLDGWAVFELTPAMLDNPNIIEGIIAFIRLRED